MAAWQLMGQFGLENLKVVEVPKRALNSHELRIRVRACSLNYRDIMVIDGRYNKNQKLPLIPVSDGAGEVIELGSLVKNFSVGDRVMATFSQKWECGVANEEALRNTLGSPLDGMLSHEVILPEGGLINIPKHLSYVEASCLPCAALTAFNAIFNVASLTPGDTLLIEGTGGVALFALQFANVLSLNTILLSSSDEKLEKAKELKAGHVINYLADKNWHETVLKITNKKGVDAVIELGGANTIEQAISSCKRGGTICLIGILGGTKTEVDLLPILMNQIKISGVFVGAKSLFVAMNRVIEHAKLRPVIDQAFSFKEAKEALMYMSSKKHFGKICIDMEKS